MTNSFSGCKIVLNNSFTKTEKRNVMNIQNNYTKPDKALQEIFENWNMKIIPHLPENLEDMARQTGVIQRKRGIHSATDLLKILFIYACSKLSFRILAVAACALGISNISDTAWRKRFSKAVPFLHEILHSMLSSFFTSPKTGSSAFGGVKNVLLVDASVVRQEGKKQEQQRIHLSYSLNENRIQQVKITDKHTAESLEHFSLKKGDLVMADAGYGTAHNYIYAQEQKADVILRITPKYFCLYDAYDNKIPLVPLLKEAEEKHMETADISGFCKYGTKSAYVRVVAQRIPENKAEKARKRKKRKASKNQRCIREYTLLCAGWVVLITSLGVEYCAEEILHLYRSRWQVELLFKRFKQNFSITTIKAGSIAYAEAETLLWLIIWTIAERQSFLAECFLAEKEESAYSVYEKCKISFLQITECLCLSWSHFVDLNDKKYFRFLSKKKRCRTNQNDEFHSAILPTLLA